MGKPHYVVVAMLLAAMVFSSCDCNESDPPLEGEAAFPERQVDFGVEKKDGAKPTATVAATEPPAAPTEPEPTREIDYRIPDDFPADIPMYKDAELTQIQPLANNAHNIVFSTADSVPNVHKFYNDEMTEKGWEITQQFERSGHAFTTFKKGETLMNLTIAEDAINPGKQVIAIMYEDVAPLQFDEF